MECPAKALLRIAGGAEGPMAAYRRYLKSTLNFGVAHANVGRMDDSLLAKFYRLEDRASHPKYFDFYAPGDIARLEAAVGRTVVVTSGGGGNKIHDRRIFDTMSRGGRTLPPIFADYSEKGGLVAWKDERERDARVAESKFISRCSSPVGECAFQAICEAAGRVCPPHEHDRQCGDLLALCCDAKAARKKAGFPFALVSHVASRCRAGRVSAEPKMQTFAALCRAHDEGEEPTVVSVLWDASRYYLLNQKYAEAFLKRSFSGRAPKGDAKRKRVSEEEPEEAPVSSCCGACRESRLYSENMSERGPQKPYTVAMSSFDWMRALGFFSSAAEETVLRACDMSTAAFDVEAMNVELDSMPGYEDLFPYEKVSAETGPRRAFARQVPVLLAWMDDAMDEPAVYDLGGEDDRWRGVDCFVADAVAGRDAAAARKLELFSPLLSHLSAVRSAHHAFFDVPEADEEERALPEEERKRRRSARSAYRHSAFGLFQRSLERLASRYVIWGFNAEAYDLVILCSALTTHLKSVNPRCRIRMVREGSKVKSYAFDGVQILEAKKMISPGYSLASFSAMCGLEESKGMFPFDLFSSREFLERTSLPSDPSEWVSRLAPDKAPSAAAVAEVRELYDRMGFSNVGEYLTHYLKNDVVLLQKSMLRLNRSFYRDLKMHPEDSNKHTISSLATAASQSFLARNKRPATFFCNDSRIYAMLKRGQRGGLTVVSRTCAGSGVDKSMFAMPGRETSDSLFNCNSHLIGAADSLPANFLHDLDVNSLYAFAASCGLPVGPAATFSRRREGMFGDEDALFSDAGSEVFANQMDSQESIFVQLAALDLYPECDYAMSGFHSGCGRVSFGNNYRMKADLLLSREEGGVRVLDYYNYHGIEYHNRGRHAPGCRKAPDGSRGMPTATASLDAMKVAYAAALTAASASAATAELPGVEVRYTAVYECDLFHAGVVFSRSGAAYRGPRELLLGEYAEGCVLGFSKTKRLSAKKLLQRIRDSPYNSSGRNDYGGFVVLTGGRETATAAFDGVLPESMGFCLQRRKIEPEEIGPFTDWQALGLHGGDAERTTMYYAKKAEEEQTVSRRSFHADGETLSFDYVKFLLEERLLEEARVAHVILYSWKHYLTPFVDWLLQQRYDLRSDPTGTLGGMTKKLTLNVIYGFYGIESRNFPTTRVLSEVKLARLGKSAISRNLVQLSLLGATEAEGRAPELLYAASSSRPDAPTFNANQIPAAILSSSRVVFFGLVLKLLRYLDPAKAEVCYMDTDSCMIACNTEALRDSVRPELLEAYDRDGTVFEDKGSARHQAGLFKTEGVFTEAYFRNLKTYSLSGGPSRDVLRVKSVPRRDQSALPTRVFGQTCDNSAVVRSVCLRPTEGFEMVMLEESRSLPQALNFKRRAVDPVHTVTF